MFSRNRKPASVYDALVVFGPVSLLYPDLDIGWIVHFESEDEACKAESKMSEIYELDSIKKTVCAS
jgi:hypothetical protein